MELVVEALMGWILLFDGSTPFGWKVEGEVKIDGGAMVLGGSKETTASTTTEFGDGLLRLEFKGEGEVAGQLLLNEKPVAPLAATGDAAAWQCLDASIEQNTVKNVHIHAVAATAGAAHEATKNEEAQTAASTSRARIGFRVPADHHLWIRKVAFKPHGLKSLFNGKDLEGWKEVPGHKSKFSVTSEGWLNVKDGNGDLQSVDQWDDFVLQLDVISNGKHLNSGVFYRAVPGEFWSGYEAQIRNQWKGNDRTQAVDFGTGGIYNRQPARKVVSTDGEWFAYTIIAHGAHHATWVNGYQTTDFTDKAKPAASARQGSKLGKGPISIQGHDPTTDLSFRNIKIAELPK